MSKMPRANGKKRAIVVRPTEIAAMRMQSEKAGLTIIRAA